MVIAKYYFFLGKYCWIFLFPFLGRGGASIYGKQFEDEITSELKHTGLLMDVLPKI